MCDEDNNKVTITFEGVVNDKNLKALVSSANSILGQNPEISEEKQDIPIEDALDLPVYEKVQLLISTAYGMGAWFTTNDICDSFEDIFTTKLKTTTASTYLARLYNDGILERRGSRNERKYKLKRELRERVPKLITQ
jgi:hypothetical protein